MQSAEGIALRNPVYGILQYVSKSAPVGGEVGFAPGCDWYVPTGTGTVNSSQRYVNIGSNGYSTGLLTANPNALWVIADNSFAGQVQLGKAASVSGWMRGSGNIFANIKAAAGTSPSATGADKIVAYVALPANILAAAGQGFQVTVFGKAAANANNKNLAVYLGATNVVTVATDGTVTVTGGTKIGDTGTLATNNGGLLLQCQIFYRAAGNSESMTTAIVGGSTHGGIGTWTDQTFDFTTALNLAVTAQATTTATDVVYQGCEITGFN